MMRFLLFLALLTSVCACQNDKAKTEALLEQVIHVHDSIMPWMDEIHGLDQELAGEMTRLHESGELIALKEVEVIRENLIQSEEKMMQWMGEFKPEERQEDTERLLRYLKAEEKKIRHVGKEMRTAIDEAKSYLNAP